MRWCSCHVYISGSETHKANHISHGNGDNVLTCVILVVSILNLKAPPSSGLPVGLSSPATTEAPVALDKWRGKSDFRKGAGQYISQWRMHEQCGV